MLREDTRLYRGMAADGSLVRLWANIDNPAQTSACLDHRLRQWGVVS